MYKLFIVIHFSNQFYFTVGVLCIIYYVQVSAIIGFFFFFVTWVRVYSAKLHLSLNFCFCFEELCC
jgi:hypothetical protein